MQFLMIITVISRMITEVTLIPHLVCGGISVLFFADCIVSAQFISAEFQGLICAIILYSLEEVINGSIGHREIGKLQSLPDMVEV